MTNIDVMGKKCFSDLQNNDDIMMVIMSIYNTYPVPGTVLNTLHVLTSFNLYSNPMR